MQNKVDPQNKRYQTCPQHVLKPVGIDSIRLSPKLRSFPLKSGHVHVRILLFKTNSAGQAGCRMIGEGGPYFFRIMVLACAGKFQCIKLKVFFPTCQVRVSRFDQSCFRLLLPPSIPAASDYALAATSRSQCALPDLNRERQMPVVTARPGRQLREPGLSGHQDPNCKRKMSH